MSTTKVITLTLMGGALAFIGWQCLEQPGQPGHRTGGHSYLGPMFFRSWGGGYHSSPTVGGTSRGGFGSTAHAHGGGAS